MTDRVQAAGHPQQQDASDRLLAASGHDLAQGWNALMDFNNFSNDLSLGIALRGADITKDAITFIGDAAVSDAAATAEGAVATGHVVAGGARAAGDAGTGQTHSALQGGRAVMAELPEASGAV